MEMIPKKALFIDRDGTIIREPEDYQIDSFEKLRFMPGAISALRSLMHRGWELVMVSNQDGLGTHLFPTEDFQGPHNLMLDTLEAEGVKFDAIFIDPTLPEDNAPTRKPGTAMLTAYLDGSYDMSKSYVIGDRPTDVALARNLGCNAIFVGEKNDAPDGVALATTDWHEIAGFLLSQGRRVEISRKTSETDINLQLDLDSTAPSTISTGLRFFDHMLDQLPHHGALSLNLTCRGDLDVDEHHTIEDVAIALGKAIKEALGDKRGIDRYGFVLPMDDCRAMVLLDFGGRAQLEWDVEFTREYVGDVPTEMFRHFFHSLATAMEANLHIVARGDNNHHLAESIFKGFARALRAAKHRDPFNYSLPSSKGLL